MSSSRSAWVIVAPIAFLASMAALAIGTVLIALAFVFGSDASTIWSVALRIGVWAWLIGLPVWLISAAVVQVTKDAAKGRHMNSTTKHQPAGPGEAQKPVAAGGATQPSRNVF